MKKIRKPLTPAIFQKRLHESENIHLTDRDEIKRNLRNNGLLRILDWNDTFRTMTPAELRLWKLKRDPRLGKFLSDLLVSVRDYYEKGPQKLSEKHASGRFELVKAYYNVPNITFTNEILDLIIPQDGYRIAKPGVNPKLWEKYNKMFSPCFNKRKNTQNDIIAMRNKAKKSILANALSAGFDGVTEARGLYIFQEGYEEIDVRLVVREFYNKDNFSLFETDFDDYDSGKRMGDYILFSDIDNKMYFVDIMDILDAYDDGVFEKIPWISATESVGYLYLISNEWIIEHSTLHEIPLIIKDNNSEENNETLEERLNNTPINKKALYESIMKNVAKQVKKVLNEDIDTLLVDNDYI